MENGRIVTVGAGPVVEPTKINNGGVEYPLPLLVKVTDLTTGVEE